MDRVSLFLLGFVTESYSRESGLKSFALKLITGRVCLIKTERSLRLGNTLPEQRRNVTGKVHSGTTVGAASRESLGSVQEPPGQEGTHFGQGDGAPGQPSRRALLQGRQAGEGERGSDAAQCSPRKEWLPPTSFSLFSFKAEVPAREQYVQEMRLHLRNNTHWLQLLLFAPRFFISIHFSSHSSLQTPYPEREDKCVGV